MSDILSLLSSLWVRDPSYTWWQAILLSTLFLILDVFFCGITWFIQKEKILECGYRKARIRKTRKAMKQWPLPQKALLRRLALEATESNPMVPFCLFLNCVNLVFAAVAAAGYLAALCTCGAGWAMVLVFYPGWSSFMFSTAVAFIPDLLWVPSERKRYGIKDKKR